MRRISRKKRIEKEIRGSRSAVLVVNTCSRYGESRFFSIVDSLEAGGITLAAAYPVRDASLLPRTLDRALQCGEKLLIVGGGDGTVSSVIGHVVYRDVVLGILPMGTGNGFARSLGIPLSLQGAVDVICSGKVADVDVGRADGEYFANACTIGLSAATVRRTPHRLKHWLGAAAYGLTGIRLFPGHKSFICRLTMPEGEHLGRTHEVIIATGGYYGVRAIASGNEADDRRLSIVFVDARSRWQMMRFWSFSLPGRHASLPGARCFSAPEVLVDCEPQQYMELDGERTMPTPVRINAVAGALKVMVPADFPDV